MTTNPYTPKSTRENDGVVLRLDIINLAIRLEYSKDMKRRQMGEDRFKALPVLLLGNHIADTHSTYTNWNMKAE